MSMAHKKKKGVGRLADPELGQLDPISERYLQIRDRIFWTMASYHFYSKAFSERPELPISRALLDQSADALARASRELLAISAEAKGAEVDLALFDAFQNGLIDARFTGTHAGGDFQWLGFAVYSRKNQCVVVRTEDIQADFARAFVLTLGKATWAKSLDRLVEAAAGLLEWRQTLLGPRIVYISEEI